MKKVLVIDDNDDILKIIAARLRANGFEPIVSKSGPEGINKAKMDKPDLILLDVMMPDMDGFQALDKLQQDSQTQNIPVIMLTAQSQAEHVAKAAKGGAIDYIIKPFDAVVLLGKIKKALS